MNSNLKIMIVVGARPNFMKAAPIIAAIRDWNTSAPGTSATTEASQLSEKTQIQQILVHTGQHYDEAMSNSFFVDLKLPKPDVCLEVGSGSHAAQTAEIMLRFEPVLAREKPDAVVVVGDVNSTLACALVAARISYDSAGTRPLIAHVEAGLRSFDRAMPEEVNRVLTDHVSDLLFVTEESGAKNLRSEGISEAKIRFVGNTMIDSLLAHKELAEKSKILDRLGLRNASSGHSSGNGVCGYALLTLHRPSNVDDRDTFLGILEGLKELSQSCPIIFSAHPRTRKRITEFGLERFFDLQDGTKATHDPVSIGPGIHLVEPLGYLDFLCLMNHASIVVTDSGGIQEETACLGVPCLTVRESTERPVTVACGTNVIAGTRPENIRAAVMAERTPPEHRRIPDKWDGKAAHRIVEAVVEEFRRVKSPLTLPTTSAAPTNHDLNRKKVMAVSSGGGHWVELLRLGRVWTDCDVVFVTVNQEYRVDVPGYRFYAISDGTRHTKVRLVRAMWKLFWILCKERPDVVISTGAAPGYIAIRIGKFLGAKTVWLDSIANAEELSMSGRLAGRCVDLWLTQWPHLAKEGGPQFRGAVL
jgi:UDP-N-acetylglucosamine 2-epimerase (non-hydrolysing)